jgi:hypothetical protein
MVAAVEPLEGRVLLSSVVVNSTSDTATGSGIVTLRDAIATADSSTSPTTITFDPAVFAAPQTIVLDGTQLELSNTTESTTITGPAAGVTVSGNNASRIFFVDRGVTAAMSGLTFANGAAVTPGFPADRGGAIENYTGNLTITNSLFVNNTALSYGGAINEDGGSVTLINDTLTENTVTGTAPDGPGCGGAISVEGAVVLNGDTITDNTAQNGGGICSNIASGDTFSVANTIIAGNIETVAGAGDATGVADETGAFTSLGNNLIGNTTESSGWISSDLTGNGASPLAADLGSLANNGGPTETMLPLTGSPAIGAGSVALIASGVTTDQRGLPRTVNSAVDIGAVETQSAPFATLAGGNLTVTGTPVADAISFTENAGTVTAILNGQSSQAFTGVTGIVVTGGAGDDTITLTGTTVPATVHGNAGDDVIVGNGAGDSLTGNVGNDNIKGGAGNDTITGAAGNDTLKGAGGDDSLSGGADNDVLKGNAGNNTLNGGAGTNALHGGVGNDTFYAETGTNDEIFADTAVNDTLYYSSSDAYVIETGVIPAQNQILVS